MKKVWLITGCSRGIGNALAKEVLANGDQLVATARSTDALTDLKTQYGEQVEVLALDVTDESAIQQAVDTTIRRFGRLDVLVNNAGYGTINSIEDTLMADFRAELETNLFGTVMLTKAALPIMRQQKSGHFIQFSSVGGRIGPVGRGAYAAAKWAVEGFSEVLQKETAPLGLKVTIVEPGGFRTDFAGASTNLQEGQPEYSQTVGAAAAFQRAYSGQQPGSPQKAARAIYHISTLSEPPLRLLLGSDAFEHVTRYDRQKAEADQTWKDLTLSTDFSSSQP